MNINLIPSKEPINLSQYNSFEDKFNALYEYASIPNIYFEISSPEALRSPEGILLEISRFSIPGGTLSYTNLTLKDAHQTLLKEVTKFLQKEDEFDNIKETLERCIVKCTQGSKENNIYDSYSFNQKIKYFVYVENRWQPTLFQYLQWPNEKMYDDFREHFTLRNGFFNELNNALNKALLLHNSTHDLSMSPYSWDSPNAELEISELLYVLQILAQRIKIDSTNGASFSKFRKSFFELFGVKASNYDKKVLQIRMRKHNESFMNELAEHLRKKHESK